MKINTCFITLLSLFPLISCQQDESSTQSESNRLQFFLSDQGVSDPGFMDCILRTHPDLTVNTISSVTELNCHSDVYSIEGIDIFSNLNVLELKGTHVPKVDISGLDNIRRLRIIDDDATTEIDTAINNEIRDVRLDNIPISNLYLNLFPHIEILSLNSLNLDSLNTNTQAIIDSIYIGSVVVPDLRFTGTEIRDINIIDSTFTSLTITGLTGINSIGVINSNVDVVNMAAVEFVSGIIISNCGVNKFDLGANKFIGYLSLSYNNIQSINLDSLTFIGPINLTGNPLSADAIAYLETKTNLDIKY